MSDRSNELIPTWTPECRTTRANCSWPECDCSNTNLADALQKHEYPPYPQTREDIAALPMCPVQWPSVASPCIPDWSGVCSNCDRIVCDPKTEDQHDAPW